MNDSAFDVVVLGSINSDFVARGVSVPRAGEGVRGETFVEASGGKGANQAVAAARLGASVAIIGRVGDDVRGRREMENLQAAGVSTAAVIVDREAPTGAALVMVEASGKKAILTVQGATSRISVADIERAAPLLRNARAVVTQLTAPVEAVACAVMIASAARVPVVLDPAPPLPIPPPVMSQLAVIRPNSREAALLTGIASDDREGARAAAAELLRRGAAAAAVQAGDEGNVLLWEGGEIYLPHVDVERVDTTGAGDAFVAALAVGIAEGRTWPEIGRMASAAAALATTALGAQSALPSRDEVERLVAAGVPAEVVMRNGEHPCCRFRGINTEERE